MLVTDVVPGGRAGAATRPPRGTLRVLSLAVRGEGDSRASLSWRSPLGRCRGGGGDLEGSSYLQAGAPLPPAGPGSAGPCPRVPGVFRGMKRCGPLRRCHPCKRAPRAALCRRRRRARGGWPGLGGHCQASLALPSAPPVPPRRTSVGKQMFSCPRRRGGGVPAPASAGLLGVGPG